MTIHPEDEHLTIEYVAKALKLGRRSVERLIAAGKLDIVRFNRKTIRIPRMSLTAYIASNRGNTSITDN